MKKESEPALLQRFLNVDATAGGDTEVAARLTAKIDLARSQVLRFLASLI